MALSISTELRRFPNERQPQAPDGNRERPGCRVSRWIPAYAATMRLTLVSCPRSRDRERSAVHEPPDRASRGESHRKSWTQVEQCPPDLVSCSGRVHYFIRFTCSHSRFKSTFASRMDLNCHSTHSRIALSPSPSLHVRRVWGMHSRLPASASTSVREKPYIKRSTAKKPR